MHEHLDPAALAAYELADRQDRLLRIYTRGEPHAAAIHDFAVREMIPMTTVYPGDLREMDVVAARLTTAFPYVDATTAYFLTQDLYDVARYPYDPDALDVSQSPLRETLTALAEWVPEHADAAGGFTLAAFHESTGCGDEDAFERLRRAGVLDAVTDSHVQGVSHIVGRALHRIAAYL